MADVMSAISNRSVAEALQVLGRRRRRCTSMLRGLIALRWWLLALLTLLLVDAMTALPTAGRWAALIVMLGAGGWAVWWSRRPANEPPQAALHDARLVEGHAHLAHHPLVSALQLGHRIDRARDAFTCALIERAEACGRAGLAGARHVAATERAAQRRQGGYVWAVLVLWLVVATVQPGVITQGLARLAWPTESQPAFSLTQLDVWIAPRHPTHGEDVSVRVQARGRPVTAAHLVELDEAGRAVQRWPMRGIDEGVFARTLSALREPTTYRVEADGASSLPLRIVPRELSPSNAFEEPAPDAQRTDIEASHDPPTPTMAERQAQVQATLTQLARDAQELAAAANEMTMETSAAQVEAFSATADALVSELEALTMSTLADALAALELPRLDDATNAAEADAWRDSLQQAAEADAATLERVAAQLAGNGVSEAHGQQAWGTNDSARPFTVAATGDYHHAVQAAAAAGIEPEAFMREIPPGYREMVDAYFRRLHADERRFQADSHQQTDTPP